MYSVAQLEKQQVNFMLPSYLIEELDGLAELYSLNRSGLILEAVRFYVASQKTEAFYSEFSESLSELSEVKRGKKTYTSLRDLIEDLVG